MSRPRVVGRCIVFLWKKKSGRFGYEIAACAMARICSGPVRQQPPIQSAPAFRHAMDNAPKLVGSELPLQLRVSAVQVSPEFGYTAMCFALAARIFRISGRI